MNNSGPIQLPRIAPLVVLIKDDTESPTLIHCNLPVSKLFIHFLSIFRPAEGRRPSWPEWLVTYQGSLPARRRSHTPVLTGPDVE